MKHATNDRQKVVPPLTSRSNLTKNVMGRFVSPLPPSSILSTPRVLANKSNGASPQQSDKQVSFLAARPASAASSTTASLNAVAAITYLDGQQKKKKQQQQRQHLNEGRQQQQPGVMLIAAPPPSSSSAPAAGGRNSGRPGSRISPTRYGPSLAALVQQEGQQQQQKSDPADDENAPPSARLERANTLLVGMQNSVASAEAYMEMSGDMLSRELQSSEFVFKMMRESVPRAKEIGALLEDMIRRAPALQVQFVAEAVQRQREAQQDMEEMRAIRDEAGAAEDANDAATNNNNTTSSSFRKKTGAGATMIVLPQTGETVPSASPGLSGAAAGARLRSAPQRRGSVSVMAVAGFSSRRGSASSMAESSVFDSSPACALGHGHGRGGGGGRGGVDLEEIEDVDQVLHDGHPLLMEVSRGLAALQRSTTNVVEIFDACSSSSQNSFETQIERWASSAQSVVEQCRESLPASEFVKVRLALNNSNKIAQETKQRLVASNSAVFALAREAAASVSVGIAEARDSFLKLQHVVNDLKIELSMAGALSSANGGGASNFSPSPSMANALDHQRSSVAETVYSGSMSNMSFRGSPAGAAAVTATAAAPSAGPNPFAGITFVCVALDGISHIVRSAAAAAGMMVMSSKIGAGSDSSVAAASSGATSAAQLAGLEFLAKTPSAFGPGGPASMTVNGRPVKPHSAVSGKITMTLIRSFISNTAGPCQGHIIAMRPNGPFLVAFDSLTAATAWARGLHLFGTALPWPEDLIASGNPFFDLVPSKTTKVDLTDATGLERAMSTAGAMAAIAYDNIVSAQQQQQQQQQQGAGGASSAPSASAPPAINQLTVTEDIFFNAWRSTLADGGVVNSPGGHLAQKMARLPLSHMKEAFTLLQRGKMYDRRGPQFKVGLAFEPHISSSSSEKLFQSLQRGGGFRLGIAAASSLCAAAKGGATLGSSDLAHLFAIARNATASSPSASALAPQTSIAQQAEEEGLKLIIAPPTLKDTASDETGVMWLPLAAVPERHRFVLRTCNAERLFQIKFASMPADIAAVAAAARETASRKAAAAAREAAGDYDYDDDVGGSGVGVGGGRSRSVSDAAAAMDEIFDPAAASFDSMWWSRDDVTGGGGAVIRPLQMSYLLPPAAPAVEVCSREMQCDEVASPSASPLRGMGNITMQLPAVDLDASAVASSYMDDVEGLAAALQGAINQSGSGADALSLVSPNARSVRSARSGGRPGTAATARRLGADNNNNSTLSVSRASTQAGQAAGNSATLRSTRGPTNNNNNGTISGAGATRTMRSGSATNRNSSPPARRKKLRREPEQVEIKVPPVMVERAEQTMEDPPGGGGDAAADLYDEPTLAVNEACKLLEDTVMWLSGTIDYSSLLGAVSRFTGPLHQLRQKGDGGAPTTTSDRSQVPILPRGQVPPSSAQHDGDDGDHNSNNNNSCNNEHHQDDEAASGADYSDGDNGGRLLRDEEEAERRAQKRKKKHINYNLSDLSAQPFTGHDADAATWDALSDTLLQHLTARLAFPVPPAQNTTLRLVVGGIFTCIAEFVHSLPPTQVKTAQDRFRRLFPGLVETGGAAASSAHGSARGAVLDGTGASAAVALKKQAGENPGSLSGDAALRILSQAAMIAQLLRDGGPSAELDQADRRAGEAAVHASAVHNKIRGTRLK